MHFTKLFSTLTDSSVWSEDKDTKIVWVTLLAMADREGRIHASIPGLARRAVVSLQECETALAKLLGPDPYSRTKEHEGRRVVEIEGGWQLLNHSKYSRLLSDEETRRRKREWWQNNRGKGAEARPPLDNSTPALDANSTPSTHVEVEVDVDVVEGVQGGTRSPAARAKPKAPRGRKGKPPADFEPTAAHRAIATERGLRFDLELAKFRDHEFATPKSDYDAAFRNWLRNATPPRGEPVRSSRELTFDDYR